MGRPRHSFIRPWVTLTDDELATLRAECKQLRVPASVIIRQALRFWIFTMRAQRTGGKVEITHADGTKQRLVVIS